MCMCVECTSMYAHVKDVTEHRWGDDERMGIGMRVRGGDIFASLHGMFHGL